MEHIGETVLQNIETMAENLFDINDEKQRTEYVQTQVFEQAQLEKINRSMTAFLQSNAKYIYTTMYSKSLFHEFEHLAQVNLASEIVSEAIGQDINVNAIDAEVAGGQFLAGLGLGIIAAFAFGLPGLLVGLLANLPIGRWAIIQFKLPKLQRQLTDHLNTYMSKLITEYSTAITKVCTQIHDPINSAREDSFASIHCDSSQVEFVLDSLRFGLTQIAEIEFTDIDIVKMIAGGYDHAELVG